MSDYIEREALLAHLFCKQDEQMDIAKEIAEFPAADVVPVVRCKDCTYFSNAKLNAKGFLVCPASGMEITEDDYCSYGEREEDNT